MSLPTRESLRLDWTRQALADPDATIERASNDASFRSYWRARSAGRSWVLMDAPPDKEDIRPWLDVASRLSRAGVHVPDIQAADAVRGFVLMEDMGDRLLLPELNESTADRLYGDAMRALLHMQLKGDTTGLPAYDEARLVAEMELMPEWLIQRHLGITPECEEWDVIESAFRALETSARAQPQVFVHRDYHSRNLMLLDPTDGLGANPGIIDFQDAVFGPISYDLVSLFKDAYIHWDEDFILDMLIRYWETARKLGLPVRAEFADFHRDFEWMGVQRHIKVLGIFARLCHRDGKDGYLADMPLVMDYLRRACKRYRDLGPLLKLLNRIDPEDTRFGYTF